MLSPFAEALVTIGAITAGTSAIAVSLCLVLGGILNARGASVSPWQLVERGAPIGAAFGLVIAFIELLQ